MIQLSEQAVFSGRMTSKGYETLVPVLWFDQPKNCCGIISGGQLEYFDLVFKSLVIIKMDTTIKPSFFKVCLICQTKLFF